MTVAFILKGYPRLSETFIAQEIHALERRGLEIEIWSLRHPTDKARHPVNAEIQAPVTYLPEYLHQEPLRVLRAWWKLRGTPDYAKVHALWRRDLKRDPTRNRIRRFGQALVLAAEMPDSVTALHFHFIHTPASVTRYAALIRKLPFTGSAHAKDIWITPDWEKREKLSDLSWLTTCTASGAAHLRELSPLTAGKVHLDYHGLDLDRFPPPPVRPKGEPGPVTLVSVGRAVEKKGYDDLLDALARLPDGLDWRFVHIGGGPLLAGLKEKARQLKIDARIDWRGAQPQQAVLEALRSADIFVLASKIARDGDRDGLPNVLMEAQSQRLAVVATNVSAIPELIEDGRTGLLVPPEDPAALAMAIGRLLQDAGFRVALAEAGEGRVRSAFGVERCIDDMARRFGLGPAPRAMAEGPSRQGGAGQS